MKVIMKTNARRVSPPKISSGREMAFPLTSWRKNGKLLIDKCLIYKLLVYCFSCKDFQIDIARLGNDRIRPSEGDYVSL
jgi:hypothetical protein